MLTIFLDDNADRWEHFKKSNPDACMGKGDNHSCMCGGTGKAADAVCYLRELVRKLQEENNALKKEIDEQELYIYSLQRRSERYE